MWFNSVKPLSANNLNTFTSYTFSLVKLVVTYRVDPYCKLHQMFFLSLLDILKKSDMVLKMMLKPL